MSRAAEKLRGLGLVANMLQVFVTTGSHGRGPHYSNTCAVRLSRATNLTPELVRTALACLDRIYREGFRYKKAGVVLLDFVPEHPEQGHLFLPRDPKQTALMQTMDEVNRCMGAGTVFVARAGVAPGWAMRRERMSLRYTTRWEELPVVRAYEGV